MRLLTLILLAAGLVALLWVAYNIGKVILRLVAGLLFLAVIAAVAWAVFFRSHQSRNFPPRSHHVSHFLPALRSQA